MSDLSFDATVRTVTIGGYDLRYHEAGEGPVPSCCTERGQGRRHGATSAQPARLRTIVPRHHGRPAGFGGTKFPPEYPSHYIVYTAKLLAGS